MALIPSKVRAGIAALTFAAAVVPFVLATPAEAVTVTFDENGNFFCDVPGPCLFTGFESNKPDPRGKVSGNVLIYVLNVLSQDNPTGFRFPFNFTQAILDPRTGALSDAVTFTDRSGSMTGLSSTLLVFYSFDNLGDLADVGAAPPNFCPPCQGFGNGGGQTIFEEIFSGTQARFRIGPLPGGDLLEGLSREIPGPVVGAGLPGLLAACGGLLAFARRRRRKTA